MILSPILRGRSRDPQVHVEQVVHVGTIHGHRIHEIGGCCRCYGHFEPHWAQGTWRTLIISLQTYASATSILNTTRGATENETLNVWVTVNVLGVFNIPFIALCSPNYDLQNVPEFKRVFTPHVGDTGPALAIINNVDIISNFIYLIFDSD